MFTPAPMTTMPGHRRRRSVFSPCTRRSPQSRVFWMQGLSVNDTTVGVYPYPSRPVAGDPRVGGYGYQRVRVVVFRPAGYPCVSLVKIRFYWPHMRTDVHHHVSSCHECQIRSTKKM